MTQPKGVILRVYLIYSIILIAMIAIVVRTGSIIMDGRETIFTSSSPKIQQRSALITPRRGEILDANAGPLVTSVAFYDIYIDPVTIDSKIWEKNVEGLANGLATFFGDKSAREYENYLRDARNRKKRYVLIRKGVTNDVRRELRKLPILELGRFKGGLIDTKATIVRKRPHDDLLQRTLGYIRVNGSDTVAVGLEASFNKYLAGTPGEYLEQLISNSWKPTGTIIREAIDGYDIVTTIDKDIQEVAHAELLNQLKSKGGRYGCTIVMDVKTGYIKAIVNLEKGADGRYSETYNHAVGTREVPGSTMKLAALMAALEDGKIQITDTVNAVGKYNFFDRSLKDSRDWGYGRITIKEAFEVSSNVISKVIFDSYKNNPEAYLKRIQSFGLMDKTGVALAGEREPIYSKPGDPQWWRGSLAWLSIGYEFQLTPLQMLSFYNTVANNGRYMQPQLVSHVLQGAEVIEEFKPIVLREKICSQKTIDIMQECLEGVVLNGTGKNLKSTYFSTAGKTGTAQIANRNLGYGAEGEKKYIASFAGYFPADDPIYSAIVVIAAPTDDIYGASVSGTVFAAIANKVYATSLQYHKAINESTPIASVPVSLNGHRMELNMVLNHLKVPKDVGGEGDWVMTTKQERNVKITPREIKKGLVPNVQGMGLKDALFLLEETGMKVRISGYGSVVAQSLDPGSPAVRGGVIYLELK
jgi:cell division protein FtsI (penicillin-binding protein 3)